MTALRRLLGTLRVWTGMLGLMFFGFPPIMLYIATHSRPQSWGFITRTFSFWLRVGGIEVVQEGLERLDPKGAYMLMGNHVNWLDHIILATVLPTPMVGFEKKENFRVPIYGPMMRRWGNVCVTRSADPAEAKRAAADAVRVLAEGCWFLVYPEGTRTRTGEIGPFKKGGFHAALDAGAKIVPFTYNGAWGVLATGRWWAMPGRVTITFGEPIDPADYGRERLGELIEKTRAAIQANYRGEGAAALQAAPRPAEVPTP